MAGITFAVTAPSQLAVSLGAFNAGTNKVIATGLTLTVGRGTPTVSIRARTVVSITNNMGAFVSGVVPVTFFAPDFTIWCPSITQTRADEWRIQKIQYGDGYQQRTLDGINALSRQWDLVYDFQPEATLNEMSAYLFARKARSFNFLDRGLNQVFPVFCDKWTVTYQMATKELNGSVTRRGSLAATFVKTNGVTS
jgi:phage-related protein